MSSFSPGICEVRLSPWPAPTSRILFSCFVIFTGPIAWQVFRELLTTVLKPAKLVLSVAVESVPAGAALAGKYVYTSIQLGPAIARTRLPTLSSHFVSLLKLSPSLLPPKAGNCR